MKSASSKKAAPKKAKAKTAAKKITISAPLKRDGILYARVKPAHVAYLKTQAKKTHVSLSMYMDQVLDKTIGTTI